MQVFDALTMRAVIEESRPLLVGKRVEKIYQPARDEILLSLRSKSGNMFLRVSAQGSSGRFCLVMHPVVPQQTNPPGFCQILRRHLTGAIIQDVQQIKGERIADISFSCTDELGNKEVNVLSAEIMGRHSNLILWNLKSEQILAVSHTVTEKMSRQRELALGLRYVRPPRQDKPNVFEISKQEFFEIFERAPVSSDADLAPDAFLVSVLSGLGRHLAAEIVSASGNGGSENVENLWQQVAMIQGLKEFRATMKNDLSHFSVVSWPALAGRSDEEGEWTRFPSVNDMVEHYFLAVQEKLEHHQLKERLKAELTSEMDKLKQRAKIADEQLEFALQHSTGKHYGDLILANIANIRPGQDVLTCEDFLDEQAPAVAIKLNPSLNAAQNAQHYYRQFAKSRLRQTSAQSIKSEVESRLNKIQGLLQTVEAASSRQELNSVRELMAPRMVPAAKPVETQLQQKREKKHRLLSCKSTDGLTIIIGRNRQENDFLVGRLTHPFDVWLHAQGQEGAHVLLKVPGKKDPPLSAIKEAAQIAARFSKAGLGSKVRVVYTQGRFVKRVGKDKPGMVTYEKEKTIEIDTATPMPPALRKLFH